MQGNYDSFVRYLADHPWIFGLILLWTLPWKAVALWRSAQRSQLGWFLSMLFLNTLGLLEIAYIFFFSKKEVRQQVKIDSTFESQFRSFRESRADEVVEKK